MTTPSDPNNKAPGAFPRPQDVTARPAVVVGGPAQAKNKAFKATMVGVAPPASPVVKTPATPGVKPSPSAPGNAAPSAPTQAAPSAPRNVPPSAPRNAPPSAPGSDDPRRGPPREPPKRPPPFKRGGTMLGLSPPGAMAPPEATPKAPPVVAVSDVAAPDTSIEPINLESEPPAGDAAVAAPPGTLRMGDVSATQVSRQASEPEIGSVALALESVVAAGGAVASVPPSVGMGTTMPEAAYTRGNRAPSSSPVEPTAPTEPAPYPPPADRPLESAPFAAPPGAQPFGVQLQQAPPQEFVPPPAAYQPPAPIPVQVTSAPKKRGGSLGLVFGLLFGAVALAGGALALVLVLAPESNLARTLRTLNPIGKGKETTTVAVPSAEPSVVAAVEATASGAASAEVAPSASTPTTEATASAEAALSAEPPSTASAAATEAVPSAVPTAAATAEVPEPPPAEEPPPVADGEVPPTVNRGRMEFLVNLAKARAEQCHLSGRAVGTAMAFITFGPDGKVVDARLEGEPIASAPVATCVLNKLQAVVIKPYEGGPFTHSVKIRLK